MHLPLTKFMAKKLVAFESMILLESWFRGGIFGLAFSACFVIVAMVAQQRAFNHLDHAISSSNQTLFKVE